MAPERWLALLVLVCGLGCSTGCSLVCLGIGAAIPKTKEVPADEVGQSANEGDYVNVHLHTGSAGGTYRGLVAGVPFPSSNAAHVSTGTATVPGRWPALIVETDEGERKFQFPDVESVSVKTGSYWDVGLGVGLVVDIVALMAGAIFLYGFSQFKG